MATSIGALRSGTGEKQASPLATLNQFFTKNRQQLEMALPKHLNADRMVRLALTAFSQNRALSECEPRSIFASVVVASQLGLEIGVAGQGYLVPYKGKCTFVPGWQGMVDLVNRAGNATVFTGVIYRDQNYTFKDGARRDLTIHNETALDDAKDITHAYAIGWVKGAEYPHIELWPVAKIAKHRDKYNKVGTRHYSFENWEMYARKVPLLQVIKYVPKSIELSTALAADAAAESGESFTIDGDGFITLADEPASPTPAPSAAGASTSEAQTGQREPAREAMTME